MVGHNSYIHSTAIYGRVVLVTLAGPYTAKLQGSIIDKTTFLILHQGKIFPSMKQ